MALADTLTHFAITLPGDGSRAQVMVDGVDVADQVGALRLEAATGRSPILTLIGKAGGAVTGEGIVVTEGDAPLPAEVIVEFLSRIDPGQLERAALTRDVPYGEGMTMHAALLVLTDWARGV